MKKVFLKIMSKEAPKMKKLIIGVALLLGAVPFLSANDLNYAGSLVNTVVCSTQNFDLDLNLKKIDEATIQVIYSTASPSTVTFGDGAVSTGNITVASLVGLTTTYAVNNTTVIDNTRLSTQTLTINGYPLSLANLVGASGPASAILICNALNSLWGNVFQSTVSPAGGAVIVSTAVLVGTVGNNYSIVSSSTPIITSSGSFSGGANSAILMIAGYNLVANLDYPVGATTGATATNIGAVISARFGHIATATVSGSVVYASATMVGAGTNFSLYSSTPTGLVLSGASMTGGTDPDIFGASQSIVGPYNAIENGTYYTPKTNGLILKAPTQWGTALPVLLTKTAGTYPLPLVDKTTYYATNITATGFQLATTSTGAIAGSAIVFTTTTTAWGAGAFVLTPAPVAGTFTLTPQKSNDGVNFFSIQLSTNGPAAGLSWTTTGSSVIYDFVNMTYKWLRFVYGNGSFGGANLNILINGEGKARSNY